MAGLTIITGKQTGTHFVLTNRTMSLGRDPSRDIQIVDPKVSRRHAVIRHHESAHLIMVTKAKNGILINGNEADCEVTLCDGDEITLGDTAMRFDQASSPDQTDAVFRCKIADQQARDANTMM